MTPIDGVLAAIILVLLAMLHRQAVVHQRSIDRLLLLGKSSSPGEAIAAYERLNRIERAREEIVAQRARVRGADQPEVARKEDPVARWFGFRRRPKMTSGGNP